LPEALANLAYEEHAECTEWAGKNLDPNSLDARTGDFESSVLHEQWLRVLVQSSPKWPGPSG